MGVAAKFYSTGSLCFDVVNLTTGTLILDPIVLSNYARCMGVELPRYLTAYSACASVACVSLSLSIAYRPRIRQSVEYIAYLLVLAFCAWWFH